MCSTQLVISLELANFFFLEIDYDRGAERGDKNLDYSIVVLY